MGSFLCNSHSVCLHCGVRHSHAGFNFLSIFVKQICLWLWPHCLLFSLQNAVSVLCYGTINANQTSPTAAASRCECVTGRNSHRRGGVFVALTVIFYHEYNHEEHYFSFYYGSVLMNIATGVSSGVFLSIKTEILRIITLKSVSSKKETRLSFWL